MAPSSSSSSSSSSSAPSAKLQPNFDMGLNSDSHSHFLQPKSGWFTGPRTKSLSGPLRPGQGAAPAGRGRRSSRGTRSLTWAGLALAAGGSLFAARSFTDSRGVASDGLQAIGHPSTAFLATSPTFLATAASGQPGLNGDILARRAGFRDAASGWSDEAFGERLTRTQWLRLYRTLGLDEGASRAEINRAAGRLRRKYAGDEEALERVEQAHLWLMTKLLNEPEDLVTSPSAIRESLGSGFGLGKLFEAPTRAELGSTTFLMLLFALLGCLAPNQATTFVGFAAMTCLSLTYQRHRPSPVQDQFGRDGEVQKVNYKEAALAAAMTMSALVLGFGLAIVATRLLRRSAAFSPSPALMSLCACSTLWMLATCGKVYRFFEP